MKNKYLSMYKNKYGAWEPYYESDKRYMLSYSYGELLLFKILDKKNMRKYNFHKKVFALFEFIFENNREGWKSIEQTRKIVCMIVGHIDVLEIKYKDFNEVRKIPASIAYENLGQKDFEDLFNKILDWAAEYFSMDTEDIQVELSNFM